MKVKFLGAAGTVTGSCYLLEVPFKGKKKKYLVDCGMFQGKDEDKNQLKFSFNPKEVSAVFLTHAHIDHSGLLPKLWREGFRGKIYANSATADLCKIMLEDSANIQEETVKDKNKVRKNKGLKLLEPLYSVKDAKQTQKLFRKISYGNKKNVDEDISVRFRDAGHIVGSACIEVFIKSENKKLVFSGDLGQYNSMIVDSPADIDKADYVFLESTYGDRKHESPKKAMKTLKKAVKRTYKKQGKLMIPSFAIERTQQLLLTFKRLQDKGEFPKEKVFLDSPLAIKATDIFRKHSDLFNKKAGKLEKPFSFKGFKTTSSVEESKKINSYNKPCIVIAGSGMASGGRISHHFLHGIDDKKNSVLFVGYQAEGTLGREILEGAEKAEILGKVMDIKAKIYSIESLSAHADYKDLIKWLKNFEEKPSKIFITHGEEKSSEALKKKLKRKGYDCYIPSLWEKVEV